MSTLELLQAAPRLALRQEQVDVPELGGALVVRGLMASELFAIENMRAQATRRVRDARREHDAMVRSLPAGATPPAFVPPELDFEEMQAYGRYVVHLLARAVQVSNGLAAYTADDWEIVAQHHPRVLDRLQAVAERLSGMHAEDVEKN